jgi:hypothetical protein
VGPPPTHLFSPWVQFGVTAAYAIVAIVVGVIIFRKRDA